MRNQIMLLIIFSFLQLHCERKEQQPAVFDLQPEVVEAKAYVVSQDKTAPPEIIPVKEIKNKASKPKVIPFHSNVSPVGKPKRVVAGAPKICVPGQDAFLKPETNPAIDSPFAAGPPEIIVAKEPQINNNSLESFSLFKVQQGLKTNWIFPIIQDKAGNLWISSIEGGVSKYDGRSFTNYTIAQGLSSDQVLSILEDKKGNIWLGTLGHGLNKFDGTSFTHYTSAQGLRGNYVRRIIEDKKGNIWAGTEVGIISFDGKTFTHYTTAQGLISNNVDCIINDKNGNIWIGTGQGVSKFDGEGKFTNYTRDQGLSNDSIRCIAEDSKGDLWISMVNSGVSKFDIKGQFFEHYSAEQGLSNKVNCILKDDSGNLWFGTEDKGVIKFDGTSFTQSGMEQGLNSNNVHSIAEDKTGNLWIGTGDGLCKYHVKPFTHFNASTGFSEGNYYSIVEDKAGNLWGGLHGGGIDRFNGKTITHYGTDQGLRNNEVMCLLEDGNNLWIGTKPGLTKYDGTSFIQVEYFDPHTAVFAALKDSKGNIWFGTNQGVDKYDGKKLMHFGVAQGLSRESVTSICEDGKGNIWLGMEYDSMLNKLELPLTETGRHTITHYNIHQGSISSIGCIKKDKKNNLWFGTTNRGVVKYDGTNFSRYTTAQGLSNNGVNSIVEDNDGNMWFLTYNGLCKMPAGQLNEEKRKVADQPRGPLIINYLYADGFLGIGGQWNSLILRRDGNIWAGTDNRITCYHPETDIHDTTPPHIQITSVSLFSDNINWFDLEKKKDTTLTLRNGMAIHDLKFTELSKWYNIPQHLDLAYNNNYLTFQFAGITTNNPRHVKYQYRLEGLDENWSSITENPYATYSDLPHGSYTFLVKAVNRDGYWSNEFSYPFNIRPPWWKTWWFRVIALSFFIAFIYAVVRWRLQLKFHLRLERSEKQKELAQLQQQKTELEMQALRAQMNPHFIFNSLNSINRFILQNNKAQASEYLTKFSKLVRMILQNSQAASITLESELESLDLYLNLEALRFNYHFDYKISVPKDMDISALQVPPLILQPYVENAIWHGLMHKEEKGQLDVEVSEEDNHLNFKITDNGVGRDKAAALASKSATKHKSMGLRITADRIAMLHKSTTLTSPVTINDLVDADGGAAGTEVIIKMPAIQ